MKRITKYMVILTTILGLQVNIFASQTLDNDKSTANIDVNVEIPATVLSAEVPLKLICAIDPNVPDTNNAFVSPKFKITSKTNAPITVNLEIKSNNPSTLNLVAPTEKAWQNLGSEDTTKYLSVGVEKNANITWTPNSYSENLNPECQTELSLKAKHGMAFEPNISFDLKIVTTISLQ